METSRNEQILQSIINGQSYEEAAQSRIEELLIELKAAIEAGGGGGGGYPPDGVTIILSNGKIKAVQATENKYGIIKPDNDTVKINTDGNLEATATELTELQMNNILNILN